MLSKKSKKKEIWKAEKLKKLGFSSTFRLAVYDQPRKAYLYCRHRYYRIGGGLVVIDWRWSTAKIFLINNFYFFCAGEAIPSFVGNTVDSLDKNLEEAKRKTQVSRKDVNIVILPLAIACYH